MDLQTLYCTQEDILITIIVFLASCNPIMPYFKVLEQYWNLWRNLQVDTSRKFFTSIFVFHTSEEPWSTEFQGHRSNLQFSEKSMCRPPGSTLYKVIPIPSCLWRHKTPTHPTSRSSDKIEIFLKIDVIFSLPNSCSVTPKTNFGDF